LCYWVRFQSENHTVNLQWAYRNFSEMGPIAVDDVPEPYRAEIEAEVELE
jgi:hypothetical protein